MTQPEVIFEFIQCGNSIKVTAFDVITKLEVSVIAPANTSQPHLEKLALNKLDYVMKRSK